MQKHRQYLCVSNHQQTSAVDQKLHIFLHEETSSVQNIVQSYNVLSNEIENMASVSEYSYDLVHVTVFTFNSLEVEQQQPILSSLKEIRQITFSVS